MLGKIYALVRVAAVVVAIAAAFVVIPMATAILLVLGAIAGLGVDKADRTRLYLVAVLLTVAAGSLGAIPEAGSYLATIFGGLAAAYVGASVVALTLSLADNIRDSFAKSPA